VQIDPKSGPSLQSLQPAPNQQAASQANRVVDSLLSSTGFAPTALLAGLLSELKRQPEVRAEVVRLLRQRLDKGELLTPAASAEVARMLLDAESMRE